MNRTIKRDACNIPTKIALSSFLIVYQKRKVFGSLRINPFPVLHDISTENANLAILVLCLIFQANTSFLFCLSTCKIDRLVISYTLSSVTKKKPKACRTMGLMSSLGDRRRRRMTVRQIGGVSFQIKHSANISLNLSLKC